MIVLEWMSACIGKEPWVTTGPRAPARTRRVVAWDWQLEAACAGLSTSVFFEADNERGASFRKREHEAKAICAHCPVISECLREALARNEAHGVWGGLNTDERMRLAATASA